MLTGRVSVFGTQNGSLAVAGGRETVKAINSLLALPFSLRVATKDWHPQDHISFASNHAGKQPFVDFATVTNPLNPAEKPYETRLWPDHCVQGSPGAELIPELDHAHIHRIVEKGTNRDVEMYSAFYDPFTNPRVSDSGLAAMLREPAAITHVYVVGLAADYCVRCTALDAHKEGFVTYIVQEATRPVDPAGWLTEQKQMQAAGVGIVSMDGPEVARVKARMQ